MSLESHTTDLKTTSQRQSVTTDLVPLGVRVAAAWSWRLIIIGIAAAAFIWLLVKVSQIIVPLFVAMLLAALLMPIVNWAVRIGLPRWLGVITALLTLAAAVSVLVWLIVHNFANGFSGIGDKITDVWNQSLVWLQKPPLNIDVSHIKFGMDDVLQAIEKNQNRVLSGALGVASSAGNIAAGTLLTLFSLIFLLLDGKRIWFWVLGFLPSKAHLPVHSAARAGWGSVGEYVRIQIFVAFVDGLGIGLGAYFIGVPFAVPIGILVFLGSFIPFLGAIVTGAFASLVALIYVGPVAALLMLGVVLLVQQIEGNILQPLVMGSAVQVHPLGVVLAVSAGAMLAGIPGALFAVPLAASANTIVNTLNEGKWRGKPDPMVEYRAVQAAKKKRKSKLSRLQKQKQENS